MKNKNTKTSILMKHPKQHISFRAVNFLISKSYSVLIIILLHRTDKDHILKSVIKCVNIHFIINLL